MKSYLVEEPHDADIFIPWQILVSRNWYYPTILKCKYLSRKNEKFKIQDFLTRYISHRGQEDQFPSLTRGANVICTGILSRKRSPTNP